MADPVPPQFILNFGYGQLNDVSRTNVGPTYNPDTTSGVDSLKNSLETIYSYDTMSGLGALKGICIGITQLYNADSGEGWVSRMFSNSEENPKPLLAIKVRIPFLDSMLPDPFKTEPLLDWDVVQLYNTFVAADEEISGDVPSIGDIVRVDYDDRTTRRGGVYLGKVFENPIGLAVGNKSKTLVKNYCQNLRFEYLSASNKEEFEKVYERFFTENITDKPMLFEVFTNSDEESNALETMMSFSKTSNAKAKNAIRGILGEKGVKAIKGILGK